MWHIINYFPRHNNNNYMVLPWLFAYIEKHDMAYEGYFLEE